MDDLKKLKRDLQTARGAIVGGDAQGAETFVMSAIRTVDKMLGQAKLPAAAQLGSLGGTATAKRGPDYFRELAARRKTHGGGRPRKNAE